jgi:predicted acetyltransferase
VPKATIQTRAVAHAGELQAANELMGKVFAHSFDDTVQWMRHVGSAYPGFRIEHTRVAYVDGDLAGTLRITSDTIRIGEARLHMGGFGWIATAAHHRNKGVASALIDDGIRYMRERSYHVSMLFGIPNFYHRFGFTTTLAEYATRLDVRDLPRYQGPSFRVRAIKPGDVRLLQKMHEQSDAGTACSIIRCGAHFNYHWKQWENARVVMTPEGRVVGYFLIDRRSGYANPRRALGNTLEVEEAGVLQRANCPMVVEAAARHARENLLSEVLFCAPPGDPLIEYLHQFRSRHTMELTRGEGGMLSVVNLPETLESMVPEWESQLARHGGREFDTELTLQIDSVPYLVRCHHGAVSIHRQSGKNKLALSGEEFVHLLTGYRHLPEIASTRRRIITAEGMRLAACLFPKRHPYVWRVDRF